MKQIKTEALSMVYGENKVLDDVNLTIPEGKITALIGGNGSGKTTLLRIIARLLKPTQGIAYLDSKSIHQMATKDVARILGILP